MTEMKRMEAARALVPKTAPAGAPAVDEPRAPEAAQGGRIAAEVRADAAPRYQDARFDRARRILLHGGFGPVA